MRIDMHVHTKKYSQCAVPDAEQMVTAAIEAGLDGIVLTEHNHMWKVDEINQLREKFPGFKIFNGVEVSVKDVGDILVYGVSYSFAVYKDMPIQELVCKVREEGGIMAIAHPYRYQDYIPDEIFEYQIDGVEVMSCNIRAYMKEKVDELCRKLGAIGIAGSDAHITSSVGVFATEFNSRIENEKELVSALKSRDFSLFRDDLKIEKINKNTADRIALARKLIEDGLSKEEIKNNYGIPYVITKAAQEGKDMKII